MKRNDPLARTSFYDSSGQTERTPSSSSGGNGFLFQCILLFGAFVAELVDATLDFFLLTLKFLKLAGVADAVIIVDSSIFFMKSLFYSSRNK